MIVDVCTGVIHTQTSQARMETEFLHYIERWIDRRPRPVQIVIKTILVVLVLSLVALVVYGEVRERVLILKS